MRFHRSIICFILAASWISIPALAAEGKIRIGGHALYYRLSGSGAPPVVIDVGAGESFASWQGIVDELAKRTAVFVYDRAGYGASDPGPLPRDCRRVANELKVLLDNAGVKGPYLLVGHSLGAINLQLFAHLYPGKVHGMVLLDPAPRGWLSGRSFPALLKLFQQVSDEFLAAANSLKGSPNEAERKRAHFFLALHSEHQEMFGRSLRQLEAVRGFGNTPLTVVAAGRPNPQMGDDAEAFQKFWIEENRRLASFSTLGKFVLIEDSSHQLHRDRPERVVAEILALLK